jgi:guanylate kinase
MHPDILRVFSNTSSMKNIFIISGAAGSGKDSVIDGLQARMPLNRIITTTSRAMRPIESEGHPYSFVTPEAFKQAIEAGEFVEYSVNENGGLYGVTKSELERVSKMSGIAVWRVDWKGVVTIKKLYPEIPAIYISAPLEILEKRLRTRDAGKDEHYFKERMAYTREWLKHLDIYDYRVENEEGALDQTIKQVSNIIAKHQESH